MTQEEQTENNMPKKKNKSKKDSKQLLATMGSDMTAMLSGGSPVTDTQSNDAEGAEIGSVEMTPSSVPDNPPVTNPVQEAPVQSVESAECNGVTETEIPSEQAGGTETMPPVPVEVNINIEKSQGNAIYSSLMELQGTLENFQLDVKKDSLREVVYDAIYDAVDAHLKKEDESQKAKEENLRAQGKPATVLEVYENTVNGYTNTLNKVGKNCKIIEKQYKHIVDCLCELLGRVNLYPYEKPKFKDDSGHILLNSLYLYPWYCFKCFYSSKHVRGFFKTIAWSIWLICIVLLFFIARDNAILQKQKDKNKYVHAYFNDNEEVMMELEGIDIMFSDVETKPMHINDYREYMKECKKEAKDKAKGKKRK